MVARKNQTGFLACVGMMVILPMASNFYASGWRQEIDKPSKAVAGIPPRYTTREITEYYAQDPYGASGSRSGSNSSSNSSSDRGCAFNSNACCGLNSSMSETFWNYPRQVAQAGGDTSFSRALAHGIAADGDACSIQ